MTQSLKSRIIDIYNLSDSPVIIATVNYDLHGANENATTCLGLKNIDDIVQTAKRIVGEDKSGSFVHNEGKVIYVETICDKDETLRVIHINKDTNTEDTKSIFRSSIYEMDYRKSMFGILTNLEKISKTSNKEIKELSEQTEKEMYSVFSLLQTMIDRQKCETGLRTYYASYYDIAKTLETVLNQTNMVMQVVGMNIEYDFKNLPCITVHGDKNGFALSVIKLIRGICCFASDNTVRVSFEREDKKVKILFSVKSTKVISWQEKSIEVNDFLSALRNPRELQDAFFLTDAIREFKYDGIQVECTQNDENTVVTLTMAYEKLNVHSLNSNPLLFLGDKFSPLTIFFTPLEK